MPSRKKPAAAASSSTSGVGSLVFESKATLKKAKRARDESDEEHDEAAPSSPKVKAKKKTTTAAATAVADDDESKSSPQASPVKAKRGASSVDTSKPLSLQQQLHEEYMKVTSAELTRTLAVNNISGPSNGKTKDRLAWQCVYGELMGSPIGKCNHCGQGKLKPYIKAKDFGQDIVVAKTKWVCPGWFSEEDDALHHCNKQHVASSVKTRPFKGLGKITADDIEALSQRKADERLERENQAVARMEALGEQMDFGGGGEDDEASAFVADAHPPRAKKQKVAAAAAADSESKSDATVPAAASAAASSPKPLKSPSARKPCPYAESCYRQNPSHLAEFSHPPKKKAMADD